MWWMLATLASAQTTVEVPAGASVRDAIQGISGEGIVVVSPGADTSGVAWIGPGQVITVRSATGEPVPISGLRVHDGGEAWLGQVQVPTRVVGAQARALTVQGGTVKGSGVTLVQESAGGVGLFLGEGTVELDGLVAEGFVGQRPIWAEPQGGGRTLILRDCVLRGNRSGAIAFAGSSNAGDEIRLEGCTIEDNTSAGAPIIQVGGAAAFKLYGSRFDGNRGVGATVRAVGDLGYLGIQTSVFCPSGGLPHVDGGGAAQVVTQRTVWFGVAGGVDPLLRVTGPNASIVHDTFVGHPDGAAVTFGTSGAGVLYNNLFSGVGQALGAPPTSWNISNNLVFDAGAGWLASVDTAMIDADPGFVDAFDPTSCAVLPHLTPTSPAVDAGIVPPLPDVVDDAGAPDLGALPLGSFDTDDPDDTGDNGGPGSEEVWITGGCAAAPGGVGWAALLALALARRRSR